MRIKPLNLSLCLLVFSSGAFASENRSTVASLPAPVQSIISAAVGANSEKYNLHTVKSRLAADNQGARYEFTTSRVTVSSGNVQEAFELRSYGYGENRRTADHVAPRANRNRVEYVRLQMTEWYVNGPMGMEQGFTLPSAPGRAAGRPLTLELSLVGNLRGKVDSAGKNLLLLSSKGETMFNYSGLSAIDADGKELRAGLEIRGKQLLLNVDDRDARYPVVVDPWINVALLTPSDPQNVYGFGLTVALDGDTIVAGIPFWGNENNNFINQGAAYVFVKTGANWSSMTQTATLTASDAAFDALLGSSVAIVGDTIIAGAPAAGDLVPAVYLYVKPSTGWADMTQTAKLTASDAGMSAHSVAMSGNTIVAGGGSAAYVFVEPASGWTNMTQTAELTASTGSNLQGLGAVAIDGNTVTVSGRNSSIGLRAVGQIAVYVEPAGGWKDMTQTAILSPTDASATLAPVAISGDTIVGGDAGASTNGKIAAGNVHVFVKPAGGWTNATQTAILTASDAALRQALGTSVSISGNTIIAGAPDETINNHPFAGAVYLYTEPAAGWTNMTESLKLYNPNSGGGSGSLGFAVAIQGNTIVATRPYANFFVGNAQVYQQ